MVGAGKLSTSHPHPGAWFPSMIFTDSKSDNSGKILRQRKWAIQRDGPSEFRRQS